MSAVLSERVLVVPTPLFHELGYFQGFTADLERYLARLLDPASTSYRARHEMEHDPGFKQLIPYVLFQHVRPDGSVHVFQYTRGRGQGENRLRLKRSVGVGGHICVDDACEAGAATYAEGMRRELAEEVRIETNYSEVCLGLINDDLTDVGRVHLGVVHLFTVEQPQVAPREAEMLDASFQPVEQLLANLEAFESWSQICLEAVFSPGRGAATAG